MKKVILLLLSACSIFACTHTPKWELVWEDNFDGAEPDTSVWSRIPRGKPDWQNTQSFDDRCYEMRNGLLILKGIVNDNTEADAAQYLTGGLWTCFPRRTYRSTCQTTRSKGSMACYMDIAL